MQKKITIIAGILSATIIAGILLPMTSLDILPPVKRLDICWLSLSSMLVAFIVALAQRIVPRAIWITLTIGVAFCLSGVDLIANSEYRCAVVHEMGWSYFVLRCIMHFLPLFVVLLVFTLENMNPRANQ